MKNIGRLSLIVAFLLLPFAALAAPVGKITYIEGSVDITVGEQVRTATLGAPVNTGDILRSKSKSRAEITFVDGNIMRLAESTRVRVTNYQAAEGKTTLLHLFRGKTQNIVSRLLKSARYEVQTPTSVCGVRGTNFFAFFQNGVSGFVPKEGIIYGYNLRMPLDVKTVTPGQALMIFALNKPPVIQPATSIEVNRHVTDTAPSEGKGEKKTEEKKDGALVAPEIDSQFVLTPTEPTQESGGPQETILIFHGPQHPQKNILQDWSTQVPDSGNTQKAYNVFFPYSYPEPSDGTTAKGTLTDNINSTTGVGTAALTLQYEKASGEGSGYLEPELEIGSISGKMRDGKSMEGLMTGIPGSWMGAMSGLYANATGVGLFLGYLDGSYNENTGSLTAGGGITRTPILAQTTTGLTGLSTDLFEQLGWGLPEEGEGSFESLSYLSPDKKKLLSAWAMTSIYGGIYYPGETGSLSSWKSVYGYYDDDYIMVGNVTGYETGAGTQTDPNHLRLSGRDIFYITPGYNQFRGTGVFGGEEGIPASMGYMNFELWQGGYGGYGGAGGAGTLELEPTAFGGYWGYDDNCLYFNDAGYEEHVGEEWGFIGAWTAPWTAPAQIKVAGAYEADYSDYIEEMAPAFLLSSPVGSRPSPSDMLDDPVFEDGDFFGAVAGKIGAFAESDTDVGQRPVKAALAAVYVKDGKAGWLFDFAENSGFGSLTGSFYPTATTSDGWEAGYWLLDGRLVAMPMESRTTLSNFTLHENEIDIAAGYGNDPGNRVRGWGSINTFSLSAYDSELEATVNLPWGAFSFWVDEGYYNRGTGTGSSHPFDGKAIKIAGGSPADGFWIGKVDNPAWTSGSVWNNDISATLTGDYMTLDQIGAFSGLFYGTFDEASDGYGGYSGGWIGEGVGIFSGEPLAFSSAINGETCSGYASNAFTTSSFSGIMGGLSENLLTTGSSPIRLLGSAAWMQNPASGTASLSTAGITSYIPQTSSLSVTYQGLLTLAADSAGTLSGGVMAIYQGESGYGGILYSDDIAGTYDRETGAWKAYEGNLHVYQMNPLSSSEIMSVSYTDTYETGDVSTDLLSGGSVDLAAAQSSGLSFSGEGWGVWQRMFSGTYSGGQPGKWISVVEPRALPEEMGGGFGSEYMMFDLNAPVNGVASGTLTGALARWGEKTQHGGNPEFFTLVVGGDIDGIFDPGSVPMTLAAAGQGSHIRTDLFLAKLSDMTDNERASFETAMKIPAFDVGTANLRGTDGNLYVNMDNIKFFRFQNEADPRIWATNDVYGSYTSAPTIGDTVTLSSSGGLAGLTETFEITQWDMENNGWGASLYNNDDGDIGGNLARTEERTLPTGAGEIIPIAAMTGGAAGSITPGINTTGLPGANSFSGTAAGVVEVASEPFPTSIDIGYWGYDMSTEAEACLFVNDGGYENHVADEWGVISASNAPWYTPANIHAAGVYQMDEEDVAEINAPGFLLQSPVGSRPYQGDAFWEETLFDDEDFFGVAAGIIGPYIQTNSGRTAKAAMAALYVKDGTAGLLATFAPESNAGGLTGSFTVEEMGYGGLWQFDGTLTATPMETSPALSDFNLNEMYSENTIRMGYGSGSNLVQGTGGIGTLFFNAYDSEREIDYDLAWGVFDLWIGGDDWSETPIAVFQGTPADLNGKTIAIGGGFLNGMGVLSEFSEEEPDESGFFFTGHVSNAQWTPTMEGHGEITAPMSGEYITLDEIGTFCGWFYGLYEEGEGTGGTWTGEGVGTYFGEPLAFSSAIEGALLKATLPTTGESPNYTLTGNGAYLDGIMGGLNPDLFSTGTSPVKFIGAADYEASYNSWPGTPFIAASSLTSHIPVVSDFTGTYEGSLSVAVDSADALSGGVMAVYRESGGYGGVLYGNDIAGTYNTETGVWEADGNLNAYRMPGSYTTDPFSNIASVTPGAGSIPVQMIFGGAVDIRISETMVQGFTGANWWIWQNRFGGIIQGATPARWLVFENKTSLPIEVYGSGPANQRLLYDLAAPVNGVSEGTVVGVQSYEDVRMTSESALESFTVVMGGAVKGIFDPSTTPLTWTAVSQGGAMRTDAFLAMQSGMNDEQRAAFERAMKIPAFDVGTANLRGNNGNLYVNMDNIKFFRFQNEADPKIWATNNVYGSYTADPTVGATVTLSSSGNLAGLTQTFEVTQWSGNNWGASISKGAADTAGTLTRAETRALPSGASATIPIASMPGLAAGSITPGVNNTGLTGTGSFAGTAAGVVEIGSGY